MDTNKRVAIMIWTYALVIGSVIIAINEAWKMYQWHKQIMYIHDVVIPMQYKSRNKERPIDNLIFVDDKGLLNHRRCGYCGKHISVEEFENERYGFCDECSEDLMTEEEEEVWGI